MASPNWSGLSAPGALPRSLEEVTPDFLSRALSVRYPGTGVCELRFSQVSQGTGTRTRLHLGYAGNPAGLPPTMWLKSSFNEITDRMQAWQTLETEGRFYEIAASVQVRVPQAYASLYEPRGQCFILLEDLVASGARFNDPLRPLSYEQARSALAELARFHASLWGSARLATDLAWFPTAVTGGLGEYYFHELTRLLPRGVRGSRSHLLAGRLVDDELMAEAWQKLQSDNAADPHCLVHFDLHLGNTYVDGQGRPGAVDWACARRGTWAQDVNYFLISSLGIRDRRRWQSDLLAAYLDELAGRGVRAPGFDTAWAEFARQPLHGLMMWLFTTPEMQTEQTCETCVARFAAAMHDYDTLGLITGR